MDVSTQLKKLPSTPRGTQTKAYNGSFGKSNVWLPSTTILTLFGTIHPGGSPPGHTVDQNPVMVRIGLLVGMSMRGDGSMAHGTSAEEVHSGHARASASEDEAQVLNGSIVEFSRYSLFKLKTK